MTTFTSEDRLIAEKDGSVTINVEPIPFMGMVTLTDNKDQEQMLQAEVTSEEEWRRLEKQNNMSK